MMALLSHGVHDLDIVHSLLLKKQAHHRDRRLLEILDHPLHLLWNTMQNSTFCCDQPYGTSNLASARVVYSEELGAKSGEMFRGLLVVLIRY